MSASGYCEQCQHDHIIPTTTEALAAAVELIRSLESSGRVDFDVSTAVGIEEGVQTSDPRLNVSFLVEERGKMLGVLIATDPRTNTKVVLKAFSGKLNGHWSVSNWAPALYATEQYGGAPEDIPQFAKLQRDVAAAMAHEADLLSITEDDDRVSADVLASVKHNRQNLSRHAMQMLRSTQVICNYRGECRTISQAFLGGEGRGQPVGTGDCCATKLVSWAQVLGLRPTGIAEFYFGKRARKATRVYENVWYDACEPRCQQVLGFMLCGLENKTTVNGDQSYSEPFFAWNSPSKAENKTA